MDGNNELAWLGSGRMDGNNELAWLGSGRMDGNNEFDLYKNDT